MNRRNFIQAGVASYVCAVMPIKHTEETIETQSTTTETNVENEQHATIISFKNKVDYVFMMDDDTVEYSISLILNHQQFRYWLPHYRNLNYKYVYILRGGPNHYGLAASNKKLFISPTNEQQLTYAVRHIRYDKTGLFTDLI